MRLLTLFLFAIALTGGCIYDPSFGDVSCEQGGAARAGHECVGGVWVRADTGVVDGGAADDSVLPDGAPTDGICDAESDSDFCARLQKNCGSLTDDDNCGSTRTAECGTCAGAFEACVANVCEAVPETDTELCEAAGATCDMITVEDRTGAMRTVDCGQCTAPLTCGAGGTANTCACANADDMQFCIDNNATCGPVTALDAVCDVERTVNCGVCTLPESCGGGGVANACGCLETDAEFCARLARNCGPVTADDDCGVTRTTTCGTCALPQSCGGGGAQGVCGCVEATACVSAGAECGTLNVANQCDNIATADCGDCGAEGTCQPTNLCMCNAGYAFDGATCADIDECTLGTHNCDVNATCTNTPGGFTCACNAPFVGDGTTCSGPEPTIVEMASDTDNSFGTTLVTPTMTGVNGDLYVAIVSLRTSGVSVSTITGLGLTWTNEVSHCADDDERTIEIWTARGNTTIDSPVTVSLGGQPWASIVAVYRVANVPASGDRGQALIRNPNGVDGSCASTNTQAAFSFAYTPAYANSLVITGTAVEDTTFTPGAIWTGLDSLSRGGSGNRDAVLETMSYTNAGPTAFTVAGSFTNSRSWVTGLFEVRGN